MCVCVCVWLSVCVGSKNVKAGHKAGYIVDKTA